ncbi:hypothetical protein CNMCM8714_004455 [Aspergillus fumigatus]|nr:hypothetical protein CNMCM8714_004455 [Aspergillus fumigatus]
MSKSESTNQREKGIDSELEEANIVDWGGPNDPINPKNWPKHRKWTHIVIISLLALTTNMAPTMCAPGISGISADLDITSSAVSTLAITLYVLGLAIGPMFMSPVSEVYGRVPVYHAANIIFVAMIIGSALSWNLAQFLVFRFISGCAGGTPMALGGGTIADITTIEQRAVAMAFFSMGPLAGPVLGPVIGGFLAASKGWRWTFWLLAILGGFCSVSAFVIMSETHPKVILERKTASLRADTGNHHLRSKLAGNPLSPHQVVVQVLIRPTVLLFRSPILFVISLYVALADGVQQHRPENRLLPMIWFSPLVSLGLFIYGWTAYYKVHWMVPIIGTAFMGFGAFFVMMPAQLYLIDVFGSQAAASALGANNLLRYIFSTFLPLAGPSMYEALNYGWGNTLLGFLALAFVPGPLLFYRYGEHLRARTSVTL